MRAALFSDIHGNIDALDAILDDTSRTGVDEYWIVGDLVANGPAPAEVVRRLQSLPRTRIVRGNTDRYVLSGDVTGLLPTIDPPASLDDVPALVATTSAHAWTRGCLTAVPEGYTWLNALPVEHRTTLPDGTRVLLVHASPGRDDGHGISESTTDAELREAGWADADVDLIIVGHTHRPLKRQLDGVHIINVGSVSLPATTEHRAMWTLLDADDSAYSIERRLVEYDVTRAVRRVSEVNHPTAEWLAHKITGRAQT